MFVNTREILAAFDQTVQASFLSCALTHQTLTQRVFLIFLLQRIGPIFSFLKSDGHQRTEKLPASHSMTNEEGVFRFRILFVPKTRP